MPKLTLKSAASAAALALISAIVVYQVKKRTKGLVDDE